MWTEATLLFVVVRTHPDAPLAMSFSDIITMHSSRKYSSAVYRLEMTSSLGVSENWSLMVCGSLPLVSLGGSSAKNEACQEKMEHGVLLR